MNNRPTDYSIAGPKFHAHSEQDFAQLAAQQVADEAVEQKRPHARTQRRIVRDRIGDLDMIAAAAFSQHHEGEDEHSLLSFLAARSVAADLLERLDAQVASARRRCAA